MAIQNIPLVGAIFRAGLTQTALAMSKLRLIQGAFTPGPNDTLAELIALEATFSGYTAGGYTLTAWGAPAFSPVNGAWTVSPQTEVVFTPPGTGSPVTNNVSGWFLEDATSNLVADGVFDNVIPMQAAGDAFPITLALTEGTLLALVVCWVNGVQQ